LLLLSAAYFTVALIASALILVFRTSGPLVTAVITVSALLGGAYYSTAVIPSWLQSLSTVVPLTYGLRATRRLLLAGEPLTAVWGDVAILLVMTAALLVVGGSSFGAALRHSRRAGTLGQY
jgi:ABC-type multidrug transport system permease subunit